MKLKSTFITHESDGEQIMVDAGGSNFQGLVRSNATAAFIIDLLKNETTKDAILDALQKKYDAPKLILSAGLEKVLSSLRSIGALDE